VFRALVWGDGSSMPRRRALLVVLALLFCASTSKTASAQAFPDVSKLPDFSFLAPVIWTGAGVGLLYAVGGTAAFVVADASFIRKRRPLPAGLVVGQSFFGATLIGAGALFGDGALYLSAPLIAAGSALILAPPVVAIGRAAGRPRRPASVRLAPTGVVVSGTF
jgi:hypothetical protein